MLESIKELRKIFFLEEWQKILKIGGKTFELGKIGNSQRILKSNTKTLPQI